MGIKIGPARIAFVCLSVLITGKAMADTMLLAVNTHFDQHWPLSAFSEVSASRADGIRDTITWGKVEQTPGIYSFTAANSGYVDHACAKNIPVLLTLTPRNKIYDAAETIYSPQGRSAFAAFARTVVNRYPCIMALEIGNEINGHSLKGRMLGDMPASYIAIIKAVRDAIKPTHPRIKLLSGSSLSAATGFFERLFQNGLGPLVDGVVVHPYLPIPEQLPAQLARLRSVMERNGGARPIWASEFGFYYPTPEAAPPHALKMMTLLSAAGVERADWYALRDEKYYPNMGLFAGGTRKPAFDTFLLAHERLLSAGNAHRIDTGDPLSFIFRFGSNGPYVMWGSGAAINWSGLTKSWDARGRPITSPILLNDTPFVVEAPDGYALTPASALDDDILNFGGSAWTYSIKRTNGASVPLGWIDWNWGPYIGAPAFPNIRVVGAAVSTARPPDGPGPELIERYTNKDNGRYFLSACFETAPGKPQNVRIISAGQQLYTGKIDGLVRTTPLGFTGPSVEIYYAAATPGGPRVMRRRIRILRTPDAAPALYAPTLKEVDE